MASLPAGNADVVHEAVDVDAETVTDVHPEMAVPLLVKATVPAGVAPAMEMVAVKVSDDPTTAPDGAVDDRTVVDEAVVTDWLMAVAVDPVKSVGLVDAVKVAPTEGKVVPGLLVDSADHVHVAVETPDVVADTLTALHPEMLVPLLLVKLTLPLGLAADGEAAVTVAVRMAEEP
jgi:hypothetical protein